ncbi:MAG: tetratricopeptide repeat protein [Candidatus Promineifilaceae bacterium]|nr:tetratricopeptide repeat protein [Candidatus Promineifilaceae bacterium]
MERAGATFTNLVDTENRLGDAFGFQAVPNAVFVDEAGIVRYTKFGGFDIRKSQHRELAERFVGSSELAELQSAAEAAAGEVDEAVRTHFQEGLALYRQGQVEAALAKWRKVVELVPDNWIIRKQIWAIENPERFYAGDVDFDWQREQIAASR